MFVFLWSNEQWCRLLQLPVDDDKTENNHQCKQKAIIFSEDGLIRFLFSLLWCNLNKNSKIDLVIDFRRSVYLDMTVWVPWYCISGLFLSNQVD